MSESADLQRSITEPAVRRALMAVLIVYLAGSVVLMIVQGVVDSPGQSYWLGVVAGFVLYTCAFGLALVPRPGRFGRRPAVGVVVLTLAAQGALWSALANDGSADARLYLPMFVTAFVVETVVVFRGRLLEAWIGALAGIALTVVAGTSTDATHWWSTVQTTTVLLLVAATAATTALAPLFREIDALAIRHDRASGEEWAGRAASAARDERIARIDGLVRPLFENAIDADRVTIADVQRARLIEARLRDGIRAPAFDTAQVREAVWRARSRGVSVTLLDDGGLRDVAPEDASVVLAEVIPRLCAELGSLTTGEIVARVSPPDRTPIAAVTVARPDVRRRVEFGVSGATRVVEL
ncbi:hypothetical protein [Gordonia neofelifaecis]|nr:hypothetical protein [Gordonia neofelifaecis]